MACGDVGYECRVDASDAGVCELAFSGIELLSPDGGTYGPDASVPVLARLVRRPGFTKTGPAMATVEVDGTVVGAPTLSGDEYALPVGTAGRSGGPHSVKVTVTFADAGLSADGGFVVDATGPTLTPSVVSTPAYGMNQADVYYPSDPDQVMSFRKDAVVEVQVTSSDDDVDAASVVVEVGSGATGGSRTFSTSQPCAGSPMGFCRRFSVDLAQVPLNAIRGSLTLRAAGTDVRQNPSNLVSGIPDVPVTRWRWATRVTTNGAIKATPALTSQGLIAVGVLNGSNPGVTLVAPDAGVIWRAGTAGVEASPSVGRRGDGSEFVFFQQKDNRDSLNAVLVADAGAEGFCGQIGGSQSSPLSLALMSDDSDEVGVIGTQKSSDGGTRIAVYRPFGASACNATDSKAGAYPGNIVYDGMTTLVFPDDGERLTKRTLIGTTFGSPSQLPASMLGSGIVNGLALSQGGTQLAGGGGPGIGALFQFEVLSGADAGVVSGTPVTAPVITAANDVIAGFRVGNALELRRYGPTGLQQGASVSTVASFPAGTPGVASPVLGQGQLVYFVGNGGQLVVADQSTLAVAMQGPIYSSLAMGAVSASPTLDCNRERTGTQTGILYVATEAGYLVSLIVDSRGLDTSAAWPKYQRDAQNSGNAGRILPPACP
jgi:hypothetical protein